MVLRRLRHTCTVGVIFSTNNHQTSLPPQELRSEHMSEQSRG